MAMTKTTGRQIDGLMERASAALVETAYFKCERLCLEALQAAFRGKEYERMARICLPLQEARRQKRLAAVDTGRLVRLAAAPAEGEVEPEPGCYLIEPMLVGADGRDLRDRADAAEVPVLVVVREPRTQLGAWPIVMIGPITVRTTVAPPPNEEPTIEWMLAASEALGDEAISRIDPEDTAEERVRDLIDFLGTCPEHEKLHQALEQACRAAVASP